MAKVFGLVNPQGVIENAFYWQEDPATYPVEAGYSIVRIDNVENCGINWTYVNGEFAEPVAVVDPNIVQPLSSGTQDL
jgi:hypothetical protein